MGEAVGDRLAKALRVARLKHLWWEREGKRRARLLRDHDRGVDGKAAAEAAASKRRLVRARAALVIFIALAAATAGALGALIAGR